MDRHLFAYSFTHYLFFSAKLLLYVDISVKVSILAYLKLFPYYYFLRVRFGVFNSSDSHVQHQMTFAVGQDGHNVFVTLYIPGRASNVELFRYLCCCLAKVGRKMRVERE